MDDYYKKEAYMKAYTFVINPMTSSKFWPKSGRNPIELPPYHKQSGRLKKLREPDEVKNSKKLRRCYITIICSKCGRSEHNQKSHGQNKKQQQLKSN